MRVSKQKAAENRSQVLDVAGQLFRERGFDGVGVAEIMAAAGLTHGGFYGQFGSKDDLASEACTSAFESSAEKWAGLLRATPDKGLHAIAAFYLSRAHCDEPGKGCALPALAVEAARGSGSIRNPFTAGLKKLLRILASAFPERPGVTERERALTTAAGLVGAVMLARAVDDRALSDEILAASLKRFGDAQTG